MHLSSFWAQRSRFDLFSSSPMGLAIYGGATSLDCRLLLIFYDRLLLILQKSQGITRPSLAMLLLSFTYSGDKGFYRKAVTKLWILIKVIYRPVKIWFLVSEFTFSEEKSCSVWMHVLIFQIKCVSIGALYGQRGFSFSTKHSSHFQACVVCDLSLRY